MEQDGVSIELLSKMFILPTVYECRYQKNILLCYNNQNETSDASMSNPLLSRLNCADTIR